MDRPRRTGFGPRAQGALVALVLHGAAWALVWPALNSRPAATVPDRGPALIYLSAPTAGVAPTVHRAEPRPQALAPRHVAPPIAVETRPTPDAAVPSPSPAPTLLVAVAAPPAASLPRSAAPASAPASAAPMVASTLPARPLPGNVLPAYPEAAREDGLQGRVRLQLQIDAQGQVVAVQWLQRSGIALLDLAARDAARAWRYEPARVGGEAVPSTLALAIRFQLDQPVSTTLLASQ